MLELLSGVWWSVLFDTEQCAPALAVRSQGAVNEWMNGIFPGGEGDEPSALPVFSQLASPPPAAQQLWVRSQSPDPFPWLRGTTTCRTVRGRGEMGGFETGQHHQLGDPWPQLDSHLGFIQALLGPGSRESHDPQGWRCSELPGRAQLHEPS